MAKTHELTPRPSALSASLRDLGYSVETAVADIIDNSITAKASQVDIFCVETDGELSLAILDNGTGMDKEKLLEAMRPGTFGPDAPREETDLGRYGLGLKTASFSQCRRLTVVSAQNGKRSWLLEMKDERQDGQGRTVACRRLVRVSEERITASGQMLVAPEIEVEGWLTDLPYEAARIFRLYKDHATSEQYHSELKTDLDLERLPSGKFATNALVMSLGAFAFNILRAIGQIGLLGQYGKLRHPAKRRRLRTVMQELLYVAARVVRHGHEWILRFGRHCPAYAAIQGALVQLGRAAPVFAG